ncbi:disease resistance protein RPP2B-like [Euphorbia lathyris]|uniref:disease resistance protein RPP2B-like n=1 Tax=Euphorbia lathyris TaxID=212925 RepID=UPI003313114E
MEPMGANGNIFEFIFTNCNKLALIENHQILSYALTKFQLYAERLYSQVPSMLVGESSFCFPRTHNNLELYEGMQLQYSSCIFGTEIQLPSGWAKNDFLGFVICAVIAFKGASSRSGLRVKCRYHFQNENGDFFNDIDSYFGSWYDTRNVKDEHLFFGYDPCLHLTNDDDFDKYNKVIIQFWPEDISGHPLQCCFVVGCGASYLTKYTCVENLMRFTGKVWEFQESVKQDDFSTGKNNNGQQLEYETSFRSNQ